MPQEYEPTSWLNPEDRIQGPCDRLDAGPLKILHQKEVFYHTIEISPHKAGTPAAEKAHSMKIEMSGLDIEVCYAVTTIGRRAFALRISYCESMDSIITVDLDEELPPCGEDSLDTAHDIA